MRGQHHVANLFDGEIDQSNRPIGPGAAQKQRARWAMGTVTDSLIVMVTLRIMKRWTEPPSIVNAFTTDEPLERDIIDPSNPYGAIVPRMFHHVRSREFGFAEEAPRNDATNWA